MLDLASPRVIYDVHAESWAYVVADKERYARLLAWIREQGLDPHDIYRVEVYLIGCPYARIFAFDLNDEGQHYMRGEDIARREPHNVILTCLPPDL